MPPAKNNPREPLLKGEGLPNYKAIGANEVTDQIPILIDTLNDQFSFLEDKLKDQIDKNIRLDWQEIMTPLNNLNERLRWSWGLVSHLNGVCNSPELREAYSKKQPEVIRFNNRVGQSKVLHKALCQLREQNYRVLNTTQKRILKSELLSMKHRGVGLNEAKQKSFNTFSERLAELSTIFSNHLLDATQKWSMLLTDASEIEGLPERALDTLAEAAKRAGDRRENGGEPTANEGPWRLGLDIPSYIPFMTNATNRNLREKAYKAFVSRASEGTLNNQPLIKEILSLRYKQARLLGYKNWAELSLASKMADDVHAVEKLLEELRSAALPTARQELEKMQNCAKRCQGEESPKLAPWDINFWAERLRQESFDLNQEELRPWFPLQQVLDGLFNLCKRLFNITIEAADGEAPVWHKDVRFFNVKDNDDSILASFYLDPYCRPANKRSGAWMDECLVRQKTSKGEIIKPVAYLICNQTPPTGDKPSLMSFEEVETLFHEFGHGLQHMLTEVDYPQAAGINNVEWDAVELPSQFMENWCIDRSTLFNIARHWETGEPLSEKTFQKLLRSRNFNSGLATLRQVHFALTDIRLHSRWDPESGITPDEIRRQLSSTTTVIQPIPEDQFLCSFSHIFAGGYAAGYYSYKWAEVLSADAFAAFEEEGLQREENIKKIGGRFRKTILSLGGSRSPSEVFKSFRGRPPTTNALIRHSGLNVVNAEESH